MLNLYLYVQDDSLKFSLSMQTHNENRLKMTNFVISFKKKILVTTNIKNVKKKKFC